MKNILKKHFLNLLLLLPLLVFIGQVMYASHVNHETQAKLLRERYNEVANFVEIMNTTMQSVIMNDASTTTIETSLAAAVEYMDNMPEVFAAAYQLNENGKLQLISTRYFDDTRLMFEPIRYEAFTAKVLANHGKGEMYITYDVPDQPARNMHMYYRWVPDSSRPEDRYLIAVGVTQFAVTVKIAEWVAVGQWIGMLITLILQLLLVVWALRMENRVTPIKEQVMRDGV